MKGTTNNEISASLNLLAKSSLIVFGGVLFSKIFTYLYRVIIARSLGPQEYGIFSLAAVILGLFISLSFIGTSEGIIMHTSIYRAVNKINRIKYLYKLSIRIIFTFSIIFGAIMFLSSGYLATNIFNSPALITYLKIFSFLVPISVISIIYLNFLRAYEKIKEFSFVFNILQNIFKLGTLIFIILLGIKINPVITSYFAGILLMGIFVYYYCRMKIPELFGKDNLKENERKNIRLAFFSYSWPLFFSGLFYSIFYWIDSLSLGYLKGVTEVGFYNAAAPIALLLMLTPDLFMQLFLPLITGINSRKRFKVVEQVSKQVNKWIFAVNLPLLVLIIVFPINIINFLFGDQYLIAGKSLIILSLGLFIYSLSMVSNQLLLMKGKSKIIMLNILASSVLNLILNFILIPIDNIMSIDNSNGLVGASIATSISVMFLSVLFFIQGKRYANIIPLRRKMFKIVIFSLPAIALLYYLKSKMIINIYTMMLLSCIFIIFYAILIFVTKSADNNDWNIIKAVWIKMKGKIV